MEVVTIDLNGKKKETRGSSARGTSGQGRDASGKVGDLSTRASVVRGRGVYSRRGPFPK
jgi:hypothetical protein